MRTNPALDVPFRRGRVRNALPARGVPALAGHNTYYRRDRQGRLMAIESGDRWIKLDYDGRNRITRAHGSNGVEVRYEYERLGRLSRVTSSDGSIRRYGYNDRNELTTIDEPGASIENHFENGRCVRQINRFRDGSAPYVFDFGHELTGKRVERTESRHSDGTWLRYLWNDAGAAVAESAGLGRHEA